LGLRFFCSSYHAALRRPGAQRVAAREKALSSPGALGSAIHSPKRWNGVSSHTMPRYKSSLKRGLLSFQSRIQSSSFIGRLLLIDVCKMLFLAAARQQKA
jgi:hypothetical protein